MQFCLSVIIFVLIILDNSRKNDRNAQPLLRRFSNMRQIFQGGDVEIHVVNEDYNAAVHRQPFTQVQNMQPCIVAPVKAQISTKSLQQNYAGQRTSKPKVSLQRSTVSTPNLKRTTSYPPYSTTAKYTKFGTQPPRENRIISPEIYNKYAKLLSLLRENRSKATEKSRNQNFGNHGGVYNSKKLSSYGDASLHPWAKRAESLPVTYMMYKQQRPSLPIIPELVSVAPIKPPSPVSQFNHKEVIDRNYQLFDKIRNEAPVLFAEAALEDFHKKLWDEIVIRHVPVTSQETYILEKSTGLRLEDKILYHLTVYERYIELHNVPRLRDHVLHELDRAFEYFIDKLRKFWVELDEMETSEDFLRKFNYYHMHEHPPGMMSILYDWFDMLVCESNRIDPVKLKERLLDALKQEKKYWLLFIRE